jgi:hypothetical protein
MPIGTPRSSAICHGDGIHDHSDRTSPIQRIFSANSTCVVSRGNRRATPKQSANPKKQKPLGSMSATNARSQSCNARSSRTDRGKTQPRSLPSVIGSAASAHGFTHAVPPTACRFPPPTPDRSVTGASPPTDEAIAQTAHPLCAVRVNRAFNGMSAVGASIYCSPRHPSALQIDPPTADGDLPL